MAYDEKLAARVRDLLAAHRKIAEKKMDFTGRPLAGFVYVARSGLRNRQALAKWVARGVEFASAPDRGARRRR